MLATLDQLAPADVPSPKVERKGQTVSLSADQRALRGALLVVGAMSAVAIPAFIEYQAKAKAAQSRAN